MNPAALIDIQPLDTIEAAASRITLQPDALILLLGSFDASLAAQVRSVCGRAIAPIAIVTNALIIDDGQSCGLSAAMGQAAQQMDQPPSLLGILDPSTSTFDPHHTQLLRMPAEWPDPAKARIQIVAQCAARTAGNPKPVIVLLFGGGDQDTLTALRCARRGWPILAVKGAGGLGDAILAALAAPGQAAVADPDLGEILSTGTLCPMPLDGDVDALKRVLLGPLQQPTDVLADAWSRFDDLDLAANEKQALFSIVQVASLCLSVFAILLAIGISRGGPAASPPEWFSSGLPGTAWRHSHQVLHLLLIVVPIAISVLSGFNSRFREGNKWILLRAAAEAIKREIFRYRAQAGVYSEEQSIQISPQSRLAANIKDITSNLVQSEVNRSSLPHRQNSDPTRLTFLTPDQFLHTRIANQQGYFVKKTAKLYKRLKHLQMLILIAGGLGTFLAAVGLDVWVALTTALATAFTTKLEIDQVETTLVQYNGALTNLSNIRSWWIALTPWEKTRRKNIDLLVDQTEKALEQETAGWVQQMQTVLDKLTEKQVSADPPRGLRQDQTDRSASA